MITYTADKSPTDTFTTDKFLGLPILFRSLSAENLPKNQQIAIAQIDEVLPQTQCGLCSHQDGCFPYAYGIVVHGEAHNLCIPGGQAVTDAIFTILQNHNILRKNLSATLGKHPLNPKTQRPKTVRAIIKEDECIGCTKCIPACPVDAIIGTAKHMHTILTDLCTGCELCLPPCPVDCISLVDFDENPSDEKRHQNQQDLRQRYYLHLNRVAKNITDGTKPVVSAIESSVSNAINQNAQSPCTIDETAAKNTIEMAKLRNQIKKLNKQLATGENPTIRQKLDEATSKLNLLQSA